MQITERQAKTILSPQTAGFLMDGEYPFTHALSPYTGCGFGATTCGLFCYAPFLPSWTYRPGNMKAHGWGEAIEAKVNAAELLAGELGKLRPDRRQQLRVFMSSTTDPYQPLEKERKITQQLLRVFTQYKDLDLLVVQTRSPLAERDFELMARIPYLWLSLTIETDDQEYLATFKGGPPIKKRLELARKAVALGIPTQIAVSPCLPYTNTHDFVQTLLDTGVTRFVVDTFTAGDGLNGSRTARSAYGQLIEDWDDEQPASELYEALIEAGVTVGWSSEGFCGIPYRNEAARVAAEEREQIGSGQTSMFSRNITHPPEAIGNAIVLHWGEPGGPRKRLRGYSYLWVKYVTGFDGRYHCANSLRGTYHWPLGVPIFTPSRHTLNAHPFRYVYLCGVAQTRWADNLHIPMEHAPGETIDDVTYNGVPIHIQNARRLEIPWIEDGWRDFPRSYTTCRNWQFGVRYFGLDDGARPLQRDFTRTNPDRSAVALAKARRPAIRKKKKGDTNGTDGNP